MPSNRYSELPSPSRTVVNDLQIALRSFSFDSNNSPAVEGIVVFMRDGVNQWGNKTREA